MKKTLVVMLLSLIMGAAFMTPAFADGRGRGDERGWGPGGCDGPCACRGADGDRDKARREFQDQSRELRQQLSDKKGAYHEMLDQDNPNKEEAARLWSEIFDLQTKLRKMAGDAGINPDNGRGRKGDGRSCDGPGCGNTPRGCNFPGDCDGRSCGGPGCGNTPRGCNTPRDCDDRPCGGPGCGKGPRGFGTPCGCDGPRAGFGRGCKGPGGRW